MSGIQNLLQNNEAWAGGIEPGFFEESAKGQAPRALWIGCADSRVPPEVITGSKPGELFVHRNVANVIKREDVNLMSVLTYAVTALGVKDLIVCGHYGCGGVAASVDDQSYGVIDGWIEGIGKLGEREDLNRLCELNVLDQARTLSEIPVVKEREELRIHRLIYDLASGRLRELSE